MIFNCKILSIGFFFASFAFFSNTIQSSYKSHYFSNWEVFHIVETQNERKFDAWMRSYPNVNIFNVHNQTPLMIAAQLQNHYFVTKLLDAGAYKYYVDNFGKTARDYALIAEGSYDKVMLPSDSSNVLSAVGAGIAAGLCTYALCTLFQKSASEPILRADSSSYYYYYDYCAKCSAYVGYTADPLQLYCSSCYRAYCKQQQVYNSYQSSYRMSDRL